MSDIHHSAKFSADGIVKHGAALHLHSVGRREDAEC